MGDDFIPVNRPDMGEREKEYLLECITTGWISSEGPKVELFEKTMAALVGRNFGVAVANGSAALDIAMAALRLGPGDEVIMPSFAIISCAAAVVRTGAKPVFVDSDAATWNMDPEQIESLVGPRTRAILVVHTYGLPADMAPILDIAVRRGLLIVEDAAEMHGQTWRDRPCGSFGEISVFSFYANKNITTGEGGMVLTNDEHLATRCRALRNLCFGGGRRFVHEELGWNYRMTNLQAALGVAQLERWSEITRRKRAMGALYNKLLACIPGLELPPTDAPYATSIYWIYGVVLADFVPVDATAIMQRLADLKVGSRPFFWPLHEQPVFLKKGWYEGERYPVAERLARRGFYLPSGLGITEDEIVRAAAALRAVMAEVTDQKRVM